MEMNKNNPNTFEREMGELPPLPPRVTIAFRCRDCGCIWTFGIETPILFEMFYVKNKECLSCRKSSIEIDIIPLVPPSLSYE